MLARHATRQTWRDSIAPSHTVNVISRLGQSIGCSNTRGVRQLILKMQAFGKYSTLALANHHHGELSQMLLPVAYERHSAQEQKGNVGLIHAQA